jgi:pimeloyl-ACP methyl ester carboxylesterase
MRRSRAQIRRGVGTPVTVAQRQIRVHGQHVTYLEAGVGRGPVVVLLHGLASSSTTWADVMSLLGRRAHVIAPDLLGHGDSAKSHSGDYSLGAHAPGCATCSILDLERATVVGHSFGGGVALQFAYQYPELTERVVLVASGGLGRESTSLSARRPCPVRPPPSSRHRRDPALADRGHQPRRAS